MHDTGPDDARLIDSWHAVLRRRWVVLAVAASVLLVALVSSFLATPLYKATATLQIERRNPEVLTFRDLSQVDYSWAAYTDYYQTQYKLIASEPVARRTVERLALAAHPLFAPPPTEPGLVARLRSILPRRAAPARVTDPLDGLAGRLLAGLEVAPVRNSHLVRVSWVSADADLAAAVANGVAASYIPLTMESQLTATGQAEEFLVDQVAALKRELAAHETSLQAYGEAKRILSIDESSNITLQALRDISERRTVAQTALAAASAHEQSVLGVEPAALPEVMNSALIQALRRERATVEAQLSEESRKYGADWPGVQTLRSKLDQTASRLDTETLLIAEQVRAAAHAAYERAQGEVRNLDRLLLEQQTAAQALRRDAVEFANLQSEVQKKRETLDALISRQNEMALATRLKDVEATSSNIRVVELAKPPTGPFRPNVRLNLALGLLFGALAGVGLALLLDHLDNTIGSVEELQRLTGLPVLAAIPRHGIALTPLARVRRRAPPVESGALDLITHRDARACVSEAYRDLRTAILLSNPGQPPRKIAVTSAMPEEGKTATATNLAVVLAQLGARVLLVDTDLRRPRLHKVFGVSNRRGMSTALSGLEDEPRQLIVTTDVAGLDLLPSGPVPPNPSELLNSPTFAALARSFLDAGYDHVVYDSPPVLSVADAVILASAVDTCVVVVRAQRTPRQPVRVAVEKVRQVGGVSFGLVLNDLDPERHGTARYGYGRAYGRYGEDVPGEEPRSATGA